MAMKELEMKLPKVPKMQLDDLFTTQEERDDLKREKIVDIDITSIDNFPNHPFQVLKNEEMMNLIESIKDNGVLVPALVRPKEDGRYELVSGHRRKFASLLANMKTLPCIVRDLTDEEATIIMVDSNMQREKILPSEKAFAYKMKYEAMKKQGNRVDLTSVPPGQKLTAREILAQQTGEGATNIQRYIRLTELIPQILKMVDEDKIALRPAVEISYLKKEEQLILFDFMEMYRATPSQEQAKKLKVLSQENKLDADDIADIIEEQKPNQTPRLKLNENKIRNVLPQNIDENGIEDFLVKAIEHYKKYLKNRQRDAR